MELSELEEAFKSAVGEAKLKKKPLVAYADGWIVNQNTHEVFLYLHNQINYQMLSSYPFVVENSLQGGEESTRSFHHCKKDFEKQSDYIIIEYKPEKERRKKTTKSQTTDPPPEEITSSSKLKRKQAKKSKEKEELIIPQQSNDQGFELIKEEGKQEEGEKDLNDEQLIQLIYEEGKQEEDENDIKDIAWAFKMNPKNERDTRMLINIYRYSRKYFLEFFKTNELGIEIKRIHDRIDLHKDYRKHVGLYKPTKQWKISDTKQSNKETTTTKEFSQKFLSEQGIFKSGNSDNTQKNDAMELELEVGEDLNPSIEKGDMGKQTSIVEKPDIEENPYPLVKSKISDKIMEISFDKTEIYEEHNDNIGKQAYNENPKNFKENENKIVPQAADDGDQIDFGENENYDEKNKELDKEVNVKDSQKVCDLPEEIAQIEIPETECEKVNIGLIGKKVNVAEDIGDIEEKKKINIEAGFEKDEEKANDQMHQEEGNNNNNKNNSYEEEIAPIKLPEEDCNKINTGIIQEELNIGENIGDVEKDKKLNIEVGFYRGEEKENDQMHQEEGNNSNSDDQFEVPLAECEKVNIEEEVNVVEDIGDVEEKKKMNIEAGFEKGAEKENNQRCQEEGNHHHNFEEEILISSKAEYGKVNLGISEKGSNVKENIVDVAKNQKISIGNESEESEKKETDKMHQEEENNNSYDQENDSVRQGNWHEEKECTIHHDNHRDGDDDDDIKSPKSYNTDELNEHLRRLGTVSGMEPNISDFEDDVDPLQNEDEKLNIANHKQSLSDIYCHNQMSYLTVTANRDNVEEFTLVKETAPEYGKNTQIIRNIREDVQKEAFEVIQEEEEKESQNIICQESYQKRNVQQERTVEFDVGDKEIESNQNRDNYIKNHEDKAKNPQGNKLLHDVTNKDITPKHFIDHLLRGKKNHKKKTKDSAFSLFNSTDRWDENMIFKFQNPSDYEKYKEEQPNLKSIVEASYFKKRYVKSLDKKGLNYCGISNLERTGFSREKVFEILEEQKSLHLDPDFMKFKKTLSSIFPKEQKQKKNKNVIKEGHDARLDKQMYFL